MSAFKTEALVFPVLSEGTDQWFSSPARDGESCTLRLHIMDCQGEGLWRRGWWGLPQQEPLCLWFGDDQLHPRNTKLEGQRWKPYRPFCIFFFLGSLKKKKNNSLYFKHIQVTTERTKPNYKPHLKVFRLTVFLECRYHHVTPQTFSQYPISFG